MMPWKIALATTEPWAVALSEILPGKLRRLETVSDAVADSDTAEPT
jgi:hypothetical protein